MKRLRSPAKSLLSRGETPSVAVIIDFGCIGQQMMAGISRYLNSYGPWNLYLERMGLGEPESLLKHWRGHGIIARIRDNSIIKAVASHDVPLIIDRAPPPILTRNRKWPAICMNEPEPPEDAICQYFQDKGFRHFAFCPMPDGNSWGREKRFLTQLKKRGHTCHVFPVIKHHPTPSRVIDHRKLGKWLLSLPKPTALFAANDFRAYEILEICRSARISVPDEIAVMGNDNDLPLCELCNPPLSTIEAPFELAAYRAAQTLHAMIIGKALPAHFPMPPCKIITRQSTDITAIENPAVRQALSIIYTKAVKGLSVKELIQQMNFSRRTLERLFAKFLNKSPGDEIRRLQLNRACQLLAETQLKISEVAQLSGFANAKRLGEALHKAYKKTPVDYRMSHRI